MKHGREKAIIEIELKGVGDEDIVTVRRIIYVDNEKSDWKLNGAKSTFAKVKEMMERLNVQIDNLCNFLPQERVHSFAQLTPNQRLLETMRTVGGKQMVVRYETLTGFQSNERDLIKQCTALDAELDQLQKQNAAIETEVKRFAEREQILDRIRLIECKKPWIAYNDARDDFKVAQEEKKRLAGELQEIQQRHSPVKEQLKQIKAQLYNLKEQRTMIINGHRELTETAKRLARDVSEYENKIDELRRDIVDYQNKVKTKMDKLNTLRNQRSEIEKVVEIGRQQVPERIVRGLRDISIEIRRTQDDITSLEDQLNSVKEERTSVDNRGNRLKSDLEKMDDLKARRLQTLNMLDTNTYNAYQWIQQNRDKFRYGIYGPVFLDVKVKDARFADYVDNLIPRHILLSFIAVSSEDYKTLMHNCADRNHWKINAIELEGPDHNFTDYRPQKSRDEILRLGFDCYAVDQINAPDKVITALCEHVRVFNVPFSLKPVNDDESYRNGVYFYCSSGNRCSWKTSKYGAKKSTMTASKLRRSRNFNDSADDEGARDRIMHDLSTIVVKMREADSKVEMLSSKISAKGASINKLKQQKEAFNTEKIRINEHNNQYEKAKILIQRLDKDLDRLEKDLEEKTEETQLKKALETTCIKRAESVLESMKIALDMANMSGRTTIVLQILHLQNQYDQLEQSLKQQDDDLVAAQRVYEDASENAARLKERATALLKKAKDSGDLTPDIVKALENLPGTTEELDEMMAAENAKLQLTNDTDPHLIEMYNSRVRQISDKETALHNITDNLEQLRGEVNEMRSGWENELTDLTVQVSAHFSEYFSKINCAGEVILNKLSKDPNGSEADYTNWGIDLLVKFRDSEPLCALTAHRQSGGERSVTIIIYLMSLQKFSTSPFRVVDEINQGMDPRNERLIHRQIIETVCCGSGKSQYFLITPKLLPDLDYHENMRILAVYNGEWLADGQQWLSCRGDRWVSGEVTSQ